MSNENVVINCLFFFFYSFLLLRDISCSFSECFFLLFHEHYSSICVFCLYFYMFSNERHKTIYIVLFILTDFSSVVNIFGVKNSSYNCSAECQHCFFYFISISLFIVRCNYVYRNKITYSI
jgi:hypothetical protein